MPLSTQGPDVQRADNTFPQKIAIQQFSVNKTYCTVHQIEIYPVDSVIHPSQTVRETQMEKRVNLQWVRITPSHLMLGCGSLGPVSSWL